MLRLKKEHCLSLTLIFAAFLFASPVVANWTDGINLARSVSALPSTSTAEDVVLEVMLWLLRIFTYLSVIGFVVYGLMFIFAGANSSLAEKAKKGVGLGIIGVAIGIAGYIIIAQIDYFLT